MWDKIEHYMKKVFNWLINAFVYTALLFGYMWFCAKIEIYFTGEFSVVSLFFGAFIYGYYANKQEEEKHTVEHKNRIEQIEKDQKSLNFAKFIYETDYSSLKVIGKITLSSDWHLTPQVHIYLKTDENINHDLNNLSWIKTEEQLIKLDKYLDNIIEKGDETQKILFNAGSIYEERIDEYLMNN